MDEIFNKQMKIMAFKEKDPVRSKFVINSNIMEQTNTFNCQLSSLLYLIPELKKIIMLNIIMSPDSGIINRTLNTYKNTLD